jgi:hypothetical protein
LILLKVNDIFIKEFLNKLKKRRILKMNFLSHKNGITLIALVITIIVLLILAGVSLNVLIGNNGVLTQAQMSSLSHRIAIYKEEMEMNLAGLIDGKDTLNIRETITVLNENVKSYIPSLEDEDVGLFGIINGELYYLGDNNQVIEICEKNNISCKEDNLTSEEFINNIENKALEALLIKRAGRGFTVTDEEGNISNVGIKLENKTATNINWKIISEVENQSVVATYGLGWYYVPANTYIEDIGTLKYSYIINYDTQKAVKFDPTKHTLLSKANDLASQDGLVLNVDSTVFDNSVAASEILSNVETYFGEGVTLYNVDESFIGDNTLNFDGEDDFMVINPSTDTTVKISDLENTGFTIEYYGTLQYGKFYNLSGNYVANPGITSGGIICMTDSLSGGNWVWNGFKNFRMGLTANTYLEGMYVGTGMGLNTNDSSYISDYSLIVLNPNAPTSWNQTGQYYKIPEYNETKAYYIQIIFNPNITYSENGKEYISQKVYINGEKIVDGKLIKKVWDSFINEGKDISFLWQVGRNCSAPSQNGWAYGKLQARAIRLYNKAISDEDALLNYNATVAYYEYLSGNASGSTENTDNNAGDLSDVVTSD